MHVYIIVPYTHTNQNYVIFSLGLLKIGDNIIEVNNEDVGHMTLEDLQDLLVSQPRPTQAAFIVITNAERIIWKYSN